MKKIKEEIIECKKCFLYKNRNNPVIGQGSHSSKIIFVGEAPGAQEDKTGIPFCGSAGKILDSLLESIKVKREDVYITNLLKCRPPKNRDPQEKEIKLCVSFLEKQIKIISPQIICPLGRYAMIFLMEKFGLKEKIDTIGNLHGKVFLVEKGEYKGIKIIPLYHPAVVVYNSKLKEVLKKDFGIIKTLSK